MLSRQYTVDGILDATNTKDTVHQTWVQVVFIFYNIIELCLIELVWHIATNGISLKSVYPPNWQTIKHSIF
jgi:hypothetical protein